MALTMMIHERSRFFILKMNRKGSSAKNIPTQLNASANPVTNIFNSMRKWTGSWNTSVGLTLSYCPRLKACQNPPTVRG